MNRALTASRQAVCGKHIGTCQANSSRPVSFVNRKALLPAYRTCASARVQLAPAVRCGTSRHVRRTVCSAGVAHPSEERKEESSSLAPSFDANISVPDITMMAKGGGGMGAYQSATITKSKVSFVLPESKPEGPKLDDSGSGGDIGKINLNGGGGGDGGDGDDDDYFEENEPEGEGEGAGDGFFRVTVIPELYDKVSIGAVLSEWMKAMVDLPIIIRRAVEMGLLSSAQLVRFMSMDVRPNAARAASRALPPAWAREFVGRLMADPAFVQKMVIETTLATMSSLYYEWWVRRDRFLEELDLVMINTLGFAAATSATVWMVAPSRSYGNVHKYPWQRMLDGLPNMVFDSNGPLRNYNNQARVGGFFAKMAELSAVGVITGTLTSLAAHGAVSIRRQTNPEFEPSVPVADVARSSAGLGAFFALHANTRYQLVGGLDRYLFDRTNHLWAYLTLSSIYRVISNRVGEASRPWWQGLPTEPAKRKRRVKQRVERQDRYAYATA